MDVDLKDADVTRLRIGALPLKCPSENNFYMYFRFRTPDCAADPNFDFEPYVQIAEERIFEIARALRCGSGCVLPEQTIAWEEWGCGKNIEEGWEGVRISIAFTISCIKRR